MKLVSCLAAALIAFVPLCSSAQMIVNDPIVAKIAAQHWFQDIKNGIEMTNTAISAANQLREQIKQTLIAVKNAQTVADANRLYADAVGEYASLKQLVKIGYGITAFNKDAGKQFEKAFPDAPTNKTLTETIKHWDIATKDAIMTGFNYLHLRSDQMDGEEAQISALGKLAQDPNAGTNQILQAGLAIATQQLRELRSTQQLMLQQFALQDAMWARASTTNTGVRDVLAQAHLEQFFGQGSIQAKSP